MTTKEETMKAKPSPFGMSECCTCDAPATHVICTPDEALPFCEECAEQEVIMFPAFPAITKAEYDNYDPSDVETYGVGC